MASCIVGSYLYPIAYSGNDSTFMSLSLLPGLGFAAGLITSIKMENSLSFNSTISLGAQLKGLKMMILYKIQENIYHLTSSMRSSPNVEIILKHDFILIFWKYFQNLFSYKITRRDFKSTRTVAENQVSVKRLQFQPIPRTPVNRDLKIWIDPRNSRSRNFLILGSIFAVGYSHVVTFFQNRIGKLTIRPFN